MADAIDVIDLPVYYWRQREAGSEMSISQRQREVRNLVDRFAAVDSASRSLVALGEPELKDWYDETALQSDLRMFLDLLPDVDHAYRVRFLDLTADFLGRVDDRVLGRLVPRLRVAWRLARDRALSELIAVVAASRFGATPPIVRRGRAHYVQLPLLDDQHRAAPRHLFRAPEGIRTEVHEARWTGGRLHIRGLAYDVVRGASRPWRSVRMLWLTEDSGRRRRVRLPSRSHPIAEAPSPVPYGWSGFSVVVDPRRLRGRDGWRPGDWTFNVALFGGPRPQRRILGMGEARPALPARWVADGVRVVPYVRRGRLRLRVERPHAWVTETRVAGDAVLVVGRAQTRPVAAMLRLTRVPGVIWRSYSVEQDGAGTQWWARIPLADLMFGGGPPGRPVLVGEAGAGWRVAFADVGAEAQDLPVPADFAGVRQAVGDLEVVVRPADDEVLWLRVLLPGPVVGAADVADGLLSFTGKLPAGQPGWGDLRIVLRRRETGDPAEVPLPDVEVRAEVAGARWTARIPLTGEGAPVDGDWLLLYRQGPEAAPVDLPFDVAGRRLLPRDIEVHDRRLELLPDREREILRLGPCLG
jgi:CDP-glycerol glycerophosphotransferase